MKAYSYSSKTKEYMGEVNCQPNPLEDGFLLPGNSTLEESPITKEKQIAIWNNKWEIKRDHRNEIYWDKITKEEIKIIEIGITKDDNWTESEPISDRCIWEIDKWIEPPLTFEELQEKEKVEFAKVMPDIVKELQAKVQVLEERITILEKQKKV